MSKSELSDFIKIDGMILFILNKAYLFEILSWQYMILRDKVKKLVQNG